MSASPDRPLAPESILLIGFGEAGGALGEGLAGESGWRDAAEGRRLVAFDIAAGIGPRGRALAERARTLEIEIHREPGDYASAADLVFAAVPGSEAANAARSVRHLLRPETVYLEISTVTPRTAGEIAASSGEAGIDYVDVGATGVFPAQGYRVPMLLAGAGAARAGAWMTPLGFDAKVLSAQIGDASAVKMLRSVLMKGLEALTVECLVAARRMGLTDEVLDCLSDVDRLPFAEFVSRLVASHLVHAERRLAEVEEVNETLKEAGLTPLMSEATRRSHARTVAAGVAPADGRIPSLEEAIRILEERVVKPGGS